MHKYRISKYNPKYRNEQGIYQKDEWISYADIGSMYEGKIFRKEEYLEVEMKYCDTILKILKNFKVEEMIVKKIEINYSINELEEMLQSKNLHFETEDKIRISSLKNNMKIKMDELPSYLKLILRECFWCELIDINLLNKVVFGYDFYVYMYCMHIPRFIINDCECKGIFIEES